MQSSDRAFAGFAAAVCGLTYLIGLGMYATIFAGADLDAAGTPSIRTIAFIASNAGPLWLWYFTIYVVNGLALMMLVLALAERERAPLAALDRGRRAALVGTGCGIRTGCGCRSGRFARDLPHRPVGRGAPLADRQ